MPHLSEFRTVRFGFAVLLLFLCSASLALTQPSNFIRLPKLVIAPGGYDTVGAKNALKNATETQGIIEKTIDPESYIIGPNDVLSIGITGPQPLNYDVIVSPDAQVLVPAVPAVDVRGLSFAMAKQKIEKAVKAVYKGQSIDIALKRLKMFKVSVMGAVRTPMVVSASSADRVSEVIDRAGGYLSTASLRKIYVLREDGSKIPVDILRYFSTGEDKSNPVVLGGDKVVIPHVIDKDCIQVEGCVYQPGPYEFVPGDSLLSMLQFAQGLTSVALLDSVEITRFEESGMRTTRLFVNLNDVSCNVPLHYGDRIYVRQQSGAYEEAEAVIDGGVAHPGHYSINTKVDRLSDLIRRAGGYTDDAQPETGLLFRRKDFTWFDRELDRLSKIKPENMNENEMRYYRTKSSESMGLVSVDFEKVLTSKNPDDNPLLINKDSVYIPKSTNYVTLIGRIVRPGRVAFDKRFNYLDYISRAGGFGLRADEDEVLIQKVSGELHSAKDYTYRLDPGDNILVPERADVRFIDVFTKALSITAQLATIVGVILGVVFAYKK